MGASGRFLGIRGSGDAEALFKRVTDHIVEFLGRCVDASIFKKLTPYLGECRYEDSWGGSDTVLNWIFPDGGGNCTRSKYLWTHWVPIAVSAEWDTLAFIAKGQGFELAEDRWPLDVRGDDGFLELRGDVWLIMEDTLHGDAKYLDINELPADERALVEAARTACACGPCKTLTPEPKREDTRTQEQKDADYKRAEETLVASMMAAHERKKQREAEEAAYDARASERHREEEARQAARAAAAATAATEEAAKLDTNEATVLDMLRDPDKAMKAAQRLASGNTASVENLLALIKAEAWSDLWVLVEQYAKRVEGGWDPVIAALPTLDEKARVNAMLALAAMPRTAEQTAWLTQRIRTALESEDDDTACALAILAGRLRTVHSEMPMLLARVLDRSFIREKMRASAIEGLQRLHTEVKPMPPEIRERLLRERERGGEGASLADSLLRIW